MKTRITEAFGIKHPIVLAGMMPLGQVIGGIKDVLTCREVIERTVAQAEEVLKLKVGCLA